MQSARPWLARFVAAATSALLAAGTLALSGAAPAATATPPTTIVSMTMTGPSGTLSPGQQVTYSIAVTNTDTTTAAGNVGVTDTFPADLTFSAIDVSSSAGWSCAPAAPVTGPGNVDCNLSGTIPTNDGSGNNTSTVVLKMTVSANPTNSITNAADVDGPPASPVHAEVTNVASSSSSAANTKLAVSVSGAPGALVPGQDATYTITVTNLDATNSVALSGITDSFPADLGYQAVPTPGVGWTCPAPPVAGPGSVDCQFASPLAAGATTTLTLVLHVSAAPASHSVTDTATIDGTSPPVTGTATSDLAVSDLALTQAWTTSPTSFALTVRNQGPVAATGPIVITIPLPVNVTFSTVSPPTDWACVTNAPNLVCTNANAGGVPSGQTTVATVTVTDGANPGRFTGYPAVAFGAGGSYDPIPANNVASPLQSADTSLGDGTSGDPGLCGPAAGGVRTCDLVATDGKITVAGVGDVPVWSFAVDDTAQTVTGTATLPGVTLLAVEGETLKIVLRNDLPTNANVDPNPLRLEIPGVPVVNRLVGDGGACGPIALPPDPHLGCGNSYRNSDVLPTSDRLPSATKAGSTTTYTFDGLKPGTYMYEAGPTPNDHDVSARQIAMGVKGLLVVRPADFTTKHGLFDNPAVSPPTACAAPGTSSVFTAESLLQVDELNKEFHANPWATSLVPGGSTDPTAPGGGLDRTKYVPDVFLVNGHAFDPTTDPAKFQPVSANDCLLLHEANVGEQEKTVGLLGRRQTLIADDGQSSTTAPITGPTQYLEQNLATKYLNPGETADAVVSMAGAAAGTIYPIVDFGRHFTNGDGGTGAANLGGMISGIQVVGTPTSIGTPTLSSAGLALHGAAPVVGDVPNVTWTEANGALDLANAVILERGGTNPDHGIAMVDALPPASGTCPGVADPAHPCYANLGVGSGKLTGSLAPADLAKLASGDHVVWLRAHDSGGWQDPPTGVVFTVDQVAPPPGGPKVANLSADPVATNGGTPALSAGAAPDPASPNGDPGLCANCVTNANQDLTVDGVLTPSLPDWAVTGYSWRVLDGAIQVYPPQPVVFTVPGGDGAQLELTAADGSPFTIAVGTLSLPHDGKYTIEVTPSEKQASTGLGRTGAPTTVDFTYATGACKVLSGDPCEAASIDKIDPNPAGPQSDHTANLNYNPAVRISGTFKIDQSVLPDLNVAGGEIYFGTGAATPPPLKDGGSAIEVTPESGIWNVPSVGFHVSIPSSEFNGLPEGPVHIWVHLRDTAGNWTDWVPSQAGDLMLDKTAPVLVGAASVGTSPYVLNLTVRDQGAVTSKVVAVEWVISDPGGTLPELSQNDFTYYLSPPTDGPQALAIDLSGGPLVNGLYPAGSSVQFRIHDGAGNWSNWMTTAIP